LPWAVRAGFEDAKLTADDIDEVVLVGGSTRMPMIQELVRKLTGKEPHRGVNPDEVVAVGAAIQAGVLAGDVKDIVLLDVTPLSLGVETLGGITDVIIERNTTIPTKKSRIYTTAADNQDQVEIHVLQGERTRAADNKSLGRFSLTGIPPAPRGVPQIEVTFDIDANGILNVRAKDLATNKEQQITITGSGNLTKEEIDKMVEEAKRYADDDRKAREEQELKNRAENIAYEVERNLNELGDTLDEETKNRVRGRVAAVRQALADNNIDEIRSTFEELEKEAHDLARRLYERTASQASSGSGDSQAEEPVGTTASKDGDVIDAEFKEEAE